MECLAVFFHAYELSPGWLRDKDPMATFTRPPPTDPLSWLWVRFSYEDRLGELNSHLNMSRWNRGRMGTYPAPSTVGEYVRLCLGEQ
jgi:hypothetical protein